MELEFFHPRISAVKHVQLQKKGRAGYGAANKYRKKLNFFRFLKTSEGQSRYGAANKYCKKIEFFSILLATNRWPKSLRTLGTRLISRHFCLRDRRPWRDTMVRL